MWSLILHPWMLLIDIFGCAHSDLVMNLTSQEGRKGRKTRPESLALCTPSCMAWLEVFHGVLAQDQTNMLMLAFVTIAAMTFEDFLCYFRHSAHGQVWYEHRNSPHCY